MRSVDLPGRFPRLQLGGPSHLAQLVGISPSRLNQLALEAPNYYRPFLLPKASGGTRRIDNPRGLLKQVQSTLNKRLLAPAVSSPIAFGSIPGRQHHDVYSIHQGQKMVVTVDIEDFFPRVTHLHVFKLFRAMDVNPRSASVLTKLVTYDRRLPQGSPASPSVANLLLSGLDSELATNDNQHGVRVTRVLDDIVISGPKHRVEPIVEDTIRRIHSLGFRVNRKKLRFSHSGAPQRIMNVNVNGRPSLPRKRAANTGLSWDSLRADVHRHSRRLAETSKASIVGKLTYAARFNPQRASQLRERLDAPAPDAQPSTDDSVV